MSVLHAGRRPRALLVRLRLAEGGEALERKFRVDGQQALVARQPHDAVRPHARRQRRLEIVGRRRQAVAHDRLHPALPIGAARLLVGENVLEADDFLREPGEPGLRGVDHRQPLVELAEVLALAARGLFDALADAMADGVEPFRHEPREIGLARAQHLGDRLHAAGEFGAGAVELRHLVVDLALALGGRGGHGGMRARRADQRDRDDGEQHEGGAAADEQGVE